MTAKKELLKAFSADRRTKLSLMGYLLPRYPDAGLSLEYLNEPDQESLVGLMVDDSLAHAEQTLIGLVSDAFLAGSGVDG